jgi:hypothetical protein
LKDLAEEAYQPEKYATCLSFEEAAQRVDALKACHQRRQIDQKPPV